ncbi:hypothetical protein N0V82_005440 [Gnomoniopsis sp. IMI 355080]|nr:hypothetical protein N0V82_005440 [Gnomoniopsis sp. IMI 355080]
MHLYRPVAFSNLTAVMLYGPQVETVASLVAVWTLATTALVLRLAARRMTNTPLWLDDFTCLVAYVLGTAYNAWVLIWIRDGYGLRLDDITWLSRADAISRARRNLYFCDAFGALSVGASKPAILALYWRLFSHTRSRYAILYLGFLSLGWLVARTSIHGECFVDERKIVYGGSISHLILDSFIIVLPLFELRKLHLTLWPKLGVIAIFICGILTTICAIGVMVAVLRMPPERELSFEIKDALLLGNIEVSSQLDALRDVPISADISRKRGRTGGAASTPTPPLCLAHKPAHDAFRLDNQLIAEQHWVEHGEYGHRREGEGREEPDEYDGVA